MLLSILISYSLIIFSHILLFLFAKAIFLNTKICEIKKKMSRISDLLLSYNELIENQDKIFNADILSFTNNTNAVLFICGFGFLFCYVIMVVLNLNSSLSQSEQILHMVKSSIDVLEQNNLNFYSETSFLNDLNFTFLAYVYKNYLGPYDYAYMCPTFIERAKRHYVLTGDFNW